MYCKVNEMGLMFQCFYYYYYYFLFFNEFQFKLIYTHENRCNKNKFNIICIALSNGSIDDANMRIVRKSP